MVLMRQLTNFWVKIASRMHQHFRPNLPHG